MSSHPLFLLVFVTFFAVMIYFGWNLVSTRASRKTGGRGTESGIGGPNDPMV